jgi:hypothetical protein
MLADAIPVALAGARQKPIGEATTTATWIMSLA